MQPSQIVNRLRQIAKMIDNSCKPSKTLVAKDLRTLIAIMLHNPTAKIDGLTVDRFRRDDKKFEFTVHAKGMYKGIPIDHDIIFNTKNDRGGSAQWNPDPSPLPPDLVDDLEEEIKTHNSFLIPVVNIIITDIGDVSHKYKSSHKFHAFHVKGGFYDHYLDSDFIMDMDAPYIEFEPDPNVIYESEVPAFIEELDNNSIVQQIFEEYHKTP